MTSAPPPPDAPSNPTATVGSLRSRLGRLRARLRRITVVSGTARLLLVATLLVAGSFAADRFLDLPSAVRRFVRLGLLDRPADLGFLPWVLALAVALAGLVATARRGLSAAGVFAFVIGGVPGVCLFVAWRALLRPLSGRPSDERLAADVERRHRALNDRLLASLDFEGELAHPTRGESALFMTKTVEDAGREAQSIEFASVASGRGALVRLATALLATGVLVGVGAAMPTLTSLWWRRSALLEDVPWPRATTLVVVVRDAAGAEREKDPVTPFVVALGRSLTVRVRAQGRVPDDVEILDRTDRDGPSGRALAHRMRATPGDDGLFEYEFRDVRGDFSFFVRGGDDRDEIPVFHASVRVPPRVVGVRADLEYPAYLALPARHVDGGSFSVPEGTKIAVSFEADAPLSLAEVLVDDAPVTLAVAGGVRTFHVDAAKPFRWRVRIATEDGRENDPAIDSYEVAVEPDTPAKPEWVWPRGPVETTPEGRVPLFAATRDDHGIASLVLEIEVAGADKTSIPLAPRTADAPDAANDRAYGTDSIRSYVPLDVATLADKEGRPLAPPRRLSARIVAKDSKGQESAGPWTSIDLVRADELERSFSGRRTSLKAEIEGLRDEVRAARDLTAVPTGADAAADTERRGLRDVQYRLGKLRGEVDRATRGVTALFNAQVYGRIGAKAPIERILAIFDRRHRDVFVQATRKPGDDAARAEASLDADDEVFPYDLYRDVTRARRDRLLLDSDVLDRLITVLETSVVAGGELAPAAEEAAATAARTGAPADVAALVAAEDRLEAGLRDVLAAMSQWQSLAELTLFVRRLIEEQEALRGGIRTLDGGAKK